MVVVVSGQWWWCSVQVGADGVPVAMMLTQMTNLLLPFNIYCHLSVIALPALRARTVPMLPMSQPVCWCQMVPMW